nr:MAG: hypothetical protein [Bacteriophage sp.]
MNQYFNFTLPAVPGAIIDSVIYNKEMVNISLAFDILPPTTQLINGTLIYGEDTGSALHHRVNLTYGQVAGPYVPGETVAMHVGVSNNTLSSLILNGRGSRIVKFDIFGGAVATDLRKNGIYTYVFDGVNFWCLEMSARGILATPLYNIRAKADRDTVVNAAYGGTVIGSIEFFPTGVNPVSQYPSTTWEAMPDNVATLTGNMLTSSGIVAWIRRT